MKIVFIIPSFRGGGAERATITIADELNKLEEFEVSLVSVSAGGPLRSLASNLQIIDLKKTRARKALFSLRRELKKAKPDVVLSVLPQANILHMLVDLCTTKTWKSICMLQNYYKKIIERENKIIRFLFTNSLRFADYVIAASRGVADDMKKTVNMGSEKVKAIYNPVDVEKVIETSKDDVVENIFSHSPVLIGVGRLEKQKGFCYFIEALPEIKKKYPDAQIVLLGKGSLENELKKKARELRIEDCVHFLGFVDNPYKYMRAADVFVLSSLWEGFGLVLVEALATGTSVVATNCPHGPTEILKEGEFGRLVSPGGSKSLAVGVIQSLESKKLTTKKLEERARYFSPQKVSSEYKKLIDSLKL